MDNNFDKIIIDIIDIVKNYHNQDNYLKILDLNKIIDNLEIKLDIIENKLDIIKNQSEYVKNRDFNLDSINIIDMNKHIKTSKKYIIKNWLKQLKKKFDNINCLSS